MQAPHPLDSRSLVYNAINAERTHQDDKWPKAVGTLRVHSLGEEILLLEYYLERARCSFALGYNELVLAEILKVTAMGVRCMEHHGVVDRPAAIEVQKVLRDIDKVSDGCVSQSPRPAADATFAVIGRVTGL